MVRMLNVHVQPTETTWQESRMFMYNLQKQHGENLECPCTTYINNMVRISNVHVQPTETTW